MKTYIKNAIAVVGFGALAYGTIVAIAAACVLGVAAYANANGADSIDTVETETPTETVARSETETETETETEAETTTASVHYYDVPLSDALQAYIFALCEDYGIAPALVLAVIYHESRYQENAIGDDGDSLGLMQIKEHYHRERMERLGCTDLLNPYDNVTVGIDLLAELSDRYDTAGKVLTVYNAGARGAEEKYFSQGIYASGYAERVIDTWAEIERKGARNGA